MSPATFRAKVRGLLKRHTYAEDLELLQKKIDTLKRKLTKLRGYHL